MNLRRTIAGAAVALGSTAVMLGLGGTAHAADAGAQTRPDLDSELGKVGSVGGLARLDTKDPGGKLQALNFQNPSATALVQNLDGQVVPSLLGYDNTEDPANLELGLGS